MKLTFKTLDLKTFYVDIDETKTVWDLKAQLWKLPEVKVKPEQQQLIYAGRILSNEDDLKSYNIDERKFLVVMGKRLEIRKEIPEKLESKESKGATKSIDQPQELKPKLIPIETVTSSRAVEGAIPTSSTKAVAGTEKKNTKVEGAPSGAGAISEIMVQNIIGMGYKEADVRRALLASFNDPNRAIEYLIEGIPDISGIELSPPFGVDLTNQSNQNPLSFLRNDPRFAQMRRIIQQRPESLSAVLTRIGETNPSLLALIHDHQEDFVRMLNDTDGDPQAANQVTAYILTEQERLAVDRLIALGFSREVVIQAYLACEKNEEQTADLLCQRLEDGN